MIDPHVHLRDWNQKDKESVSHGLKVAKEAGIDRVFDMPNTNPPLIDRESILSRLSLGTEEAEKIGSSYSLYAGLTSDEEQIRAMVALHSELFPLVVGLKMFLSHSTGNMGITEIESQRKVIRTLCELSYKGVLAVHAEKESLNDMSLEDPLDYSSHSSARPAISETESVRDIIRFCEEEKFPGHLHICHISTADAVKEVVKAKERGLSISMGSTPHHALLNSDDARDAERGLKMNPPLRAESDRLFIYESLKNGVIDNVESDHAPHTLDDKRKGASGIPCFSGMLLLYHKLKEDGVSRERLLDLFGRNVIKIYGLRDEEVRLPDDSEELFSKVSSAYPIRPFKWS